MPEACREEERQENVNFVQAAHLGDHALAPEKIILQGNERNLWGRNFKD